MKKEFIPCVKNKMLRFAGKFFSWASFFSLGYVVLSLIPFGGNLSGAFFGVGGAINAEGFFYTIYLLILNFIAPIPTFFPSPNILLAIGFMIVSGNLYALYQRVGEDFPLRIWVKRGCAVVVGCALCLLPTFLMNPFIFWTLSLLGCLAMISCFVLLDLPTDTFAHSILMKKSFYIYLLCGMAFTYLPIPLIVIAVVVLIVLGIVFDFDINKWRQRVKEEREEKLCLPQLCALMLFLYLLTFVLWGDYEYISVAASWILLSIIFMCVGRALVFWGEREEIIPLPEAVSRDDVQ